MTKPLINSYYSTEGVREMCHAVKEEKGAAYKKAVQVIADYLLSLGFVKPEDHLIPAPQHKGRAEYTKDIAERLAKKTSANLCDILARIPQDALYDQKQAGRAEIPKLYLIGEIPTSGRLFFVDNVISTGITFWSAEILIPELIPLV